LYICPEPEGLPQALQTLVSIVADSKAIYFKVAGTATSILRPDKLVVYFRSLNDLIRMANKFAGLSPELRSQEAPFTARLDHQGLLSWGVDPNHHASGGWSSNGESWRLWVTNRLAAFIIAAQQSRPPIEDASAYALQRMQMDGVDVASWIPTSTWLRAMTEAEGSA
jgi:hypothetical protein